MGTCACWWCEDSAREGSEFSIPVNRPLECLLCKSVAHRHDASIIGNKKDALYSYLT